MDNLIPLSPSHASLRDIVGHDPGFAAEAIWLDEALRYERYRRRMFWLGLGCGALAGFVFALLAAGPPRHRR